MKSGYMLTVIVWIAIAILSSAVSAAQGADVSRETLPTLTMSATWAVATPTPHVAAPGVHRVWLPVVGGGG